MQMYSSEHYTYAAVEEDYVSKDEHSYNGSTMHTMKPHDHSLPKISYNQNHGNGYGGYNNHENKGHMGQYSEARYEEERRHDGWGRKDDHLAHGGIMHYNDKIRRPQPEGTYYGGYGAHQEHNGHYNEGTNYGGYGAPQGHNGPHKEGMNNGKYGAPQGHFGPRKEYVEYPEKKKVSFWEFKGIVD